MSIAIKLASLWGQGGAGAATFVGGGGGYSNGTFSVSYSGAQAGDLCVIWKTHQGVDVTGYTAQAMPARTPWDGFNGALYYRALTSGDISTGSVSVNTAGGCITAYGIYRGPTTAILQTTAKAASATGVTVSGFVKNGSESGVLAGCFHQGSSAPTGPTVTNTRESVAGTVFGSLRLSDYDPPSSYPTAGNVSWTFGATTNGEAWLAALR
ncbi:hypothetical protein [Phenylobacterium soli]|uniref:Uncharacterized protein n=1 Tax=Phenylobacterium soli TaxID=2170551 RepID=A0A328AEL5_9CAUL|nr:hypothetical protein [Phenylobacterium soli]RAK51208.1 hypothetical protein DJ017_19855 [Phenylobacterium soli]